ncbi:hypothetical protein BLOT_000001 [Blomia tropicalis]|nr:hypothetical protein BLOT_000001 [Blomia tropicalis]
MEKWFSARLTLPLDMNYFIFYYNNEQRQNHKIDFQCFNMMHHFRTKYYLIFAKNNSYSEQENQNFESIRINYIRGIVNKMH